MSNIPPTSSTGTPKPASGNGQVVPVQSLPDGLKNVARAMRVEGEVVQQNSDGTTRVKTPEGNIDIAIRGRQPQPGAKIEIDVPAGNPPRQVTIRPAPAQLPQTQPTQTPTPSTPAPTAPVQTIPQPDIPRPQTPVTTPPQGQGQTPAPAQPSTPPAAQQPSPTQPSVQNPQTSVPPPAADAFHPKPQAPLPNAPAPTTQVPQTAQPPALPPLAAGQVVTLSPLPSTSAATVTAPVTADAPDPTGQAAQNKTVFHAALTAQKAGGGLITSLLQAVKSALPATLTQTQTPPANINIGAAASTPAKTSLPLPMQPVPLFAKITSMTLPSGQTMYAQPAPAQTPSGAAGILPAATALSAQNPSAAAATAPTFSITVTTLTPQNQPVIPLVMNEGGDIQNFIVQSPRASVPVGTQITFAPMLNAGTPAPAIMTPVAAMPSFPAAPPVPNAPNLSAAHAGSSLPPAWRSLLPLMQPSSIWPAMDDVFQSFYQATPQAAQILGRIIPSPANAANFGPAALLFVAAVRAGDLPGWMGDKKLDMLHKLGKESLLSRISGETSSLSGNTDTPATEWKSYPLPLLWQNEISKIMLHVREEPFDQEKEDKENGARFVLDLSLTRMGDVQLDGMVRGKQVDLIVRTQMPVSAPMQDAMRVAYANALDGTDIYGEIGFQSDIKSWRVIGRENNLGLSA